MLLTLLVVSITLVLAVDGAPAPPVKYYASKYDHIDVDTILNTRRLVNYYAACLTNKGPCPPQGLEFKKILPEALHTACARCTEKQKTVALRTIKRIRKEYPKIWTQLAEIWDPTGEYIQRFEESFNSQNEIIPQTTTTTTTTQSSVVFQNRFGDNSNDVTVILTSTTPNKPTTAKPLITSVVNTNLVTSETASHPSTNKIFTSSTFTTTTVRTPFIKTNGVLFSIPNAVSFNSNISVNGLVSRIGSLGSKVIQAGTRIAGMLLSTVQTVVGQ